MKYVFGTIIAAAWGVGLAAQSPTQTPAGQSPAGQPQSITVSGCLTAAPQGSSMAGQPGQPGGFMLTGVTPNGGTSASSVAPATTSYTLTGGNPSDLRAYANSRVEIQGTLQPAGVSTQPGAAGVTPSAPPTGVPPAGTPPTATPPASTPPTATPPPGTPPTTTPPAGTPPTATPPSGTPPSGAPLPTGTSGTGAMHPTGTAGQMPALQLHVTAVRQIPGMCGR